MAAATGRPGIESALLGPPPGALLDRGVEIDLQVRIGQHDGADVPAGHHDAAIGGEIALALEERCTDLGHSRHGGHRRVDRRRTHVRGVVDAVDEHASEASVGVGGQLDLVDERDETLRIVDRDPARLGQPGDRPIQQPRVAEPVPDGSRRGRADAALARGAGPVEGHRESSHRTQDSGGSTAARASVASSMATNASGGATAIVDPWSWCGIWTSSPSCHQYGWSLIEPGPSR